MKITFIYQDIVLLCSKQNISLHGHQGTFPNNTLPVSNEGNFLAILTHMASNNSLLQSHSNSCPSNVSYTSKTVQIIIGVQIRTSMTECLSKDNAFFAIIVGEVTDVHANEEVLTVCLHFIDKLNPEQPEAFDFVYLDKTDCESISRATIQCQYKRGIDITKATGQAHHGAPVLHYVSIATATC